MGALRVELQLPLLAGWARRPVVLDVAGVDGRVVLQLLGRSELLALDAKGWRASGRMQRELAVRMPPAVTVSLAPLGVYLSAAQVETLVSSAVALLASTPSLTSPN